MFIKFPGSKSKRGDFYEIKAMALCVGSSYWSQIFLEMVTDFDLRKKQKILVVIRDKKKLLAFCDIKPKSHKKEFILNKVVCMKIQGKYLHKLNCLMPRNMLVFFGR